MLSMLLAETAHWRSIGSEVLSRRERFITHLANFGSTVKTNNTHGTTGPRKTKF